MAINTETKRRSTYGYTFPGLILPVTDGTITVLDRQHVCGYYAGIAASVVIGVASFTSEVVAMATFSSEALTQATFSSEALNN